MDVIVDGQTEFKPSESAADVMAIVAEASDWLHARGRSIVSVIADGASYDPTRLVDALTGKSVNSTSRLEIATEDTNALVADALTELEAVLPELPAACHELARIFQGTDPQSGYEPFQQLAGIWSHVKDRQAMIAYTLGIDFDAMPFNSRLLGDAHAELNGFLAEAVGALESGDLILLGDLLEYELAPRAEQEVAITRLLRKNP